MNFLIGIVAPAAIAAALVLVIRRALRPDPADRYVFATACGAAVFAGYLLIPGFAALVPASRWQWLPYIGVTAAVVSWLPARGGWLGGLRWLFFAAAAVIAAWKLVPTSVSLWPPRPVSIAALAIGLVALTALLDLLPDRTSGVTLIALLALVAAGVMVALVAAAISMKYAQVAGLLASALAGCWIASIRQPPIPAAVRGLLPVFAMFLGGLAYLGCLEQEPPVMALLCMPAAPLTLWAFAFGPLSRLHGRAAIVSQAAAVLVPLAIAGAIVCLSAPEAYSFLPLARPLSAGSAFSGSLTGLPVSAD